MVNTRSGARVVSTFLAGVAVAGAIACGTRGPVGPVVHEHHSVERGAATSARVEIGMTAGELEVKSGAKMLFDGNFDFNVPVLKPEIAYAVVGTTGTLKVSQGSASGNYENSWRLSIDETTPVDLHLTLGAGDAELVLGRVNLQSLAVRLGAGDLVLDLRGTPATSYKVTVQAGAGDTTIRLPAGVGISASTSGLIGDSNVSGLEKRDGRWINPRAEASPVTIDLQVQHAIGDLKIVAE
jgi:predicted membrane protein